MSDLTLEVFATTDKTQRIPVLFTPAGAVVAGKDAPATSESSAALPGVIRSTWLDGWTWCKASSKLLARHSWLPWLSAAAAVISAITATSVFVTLQQDTLSTWSRVVVGSVAALTAAITAIQGWSAARVKAINDQVSAFHKFHRKLQQDIEDSNKVLDDKYASDVEEELRGTMASMVGVSNRDWDKARKEVLKEAKEVSIPKHATS